MMRTLAAIICFAAVFQSAHAQQSIQNLPAVTTPAITDVFPVAQINPQSPTGFSTRGETTSQLATLIGGGASAFQPSISGSRMSPLGVTTSGSTATLPTGAQVVITNTGTNPMYCNVVGISPATTSDQLITANGGWFQFTPNTGATQLNCISTGGNTTANGLGGSGLPTGTGGGSGASGTITANQGTAGASAWLTADSAAIGTFAAGWNVDLGNSGSVIPWHNGGGGNPYELNILAGLEADATGASGLPSATVPGSIIYTGMNVGGNLVGLTGTANGLAVVRSAIPAGGATPGHILSAASNNATSIKGTAGTLYSVQWSNTNSTGLLDIRFYDTASVPTCSSATGVKLNFVAANTTVEGANGVSLPTMGIAFVNGIGVCITGANADNDNTNATTGLNLNYSFN